MKLSRFVGKNSILNNVKLYSNYNSKRAASSSAADKFENRNDYEKLFLDNNVRFYLKRLTGYDPTIVFQSKSLKNLNSPKYRFMTEDQLRMERELADKRAEKRLQMPPIKNPSNPSPKILQKDPALQGYIKNKLIFVDATPGFSEQERLMVVREVDGTLREATREERHRMNQTFYPVEERLMDIPKMLQPEYIEPVMQRGAYKLILDNACLHYEPEDKRFREICHQVYEHINENEAYDSLFSTRHYGGMVYYYAYTDNIEKLLHHLAMKERCEDMYDLLSLYYLINPDPEAPIQIRDESELKLSLSELVEEFRENIPSVRFDDFCRLLKFYLKTHIEDANTRGEVRKSIQKLNSNNQGKADEIAS